MHHTLLHDKYSFNQASSTVPYDIQPELHSAVDNALHLADPHESTYNS